MCCSSMLYFCSRYDIDGVVWSVVWEKKMKKKILRPSPSQAPLQVWKKNPIFKKGENHHRKQWLTIFVPDAISSSTFHHFHHQPSYLLEKSFYKCQSYPPFSMTHLYLIIIVKMGHLIKQITKGGEEMN